MSIIVVGRGAADRLRLLALLGLGGIASLGCSPTESSPGRASSKPGLSPSSQSSSEELSPQQERVLKQAARSPATSIASVDWPQALLYPSLNPDSLSPEARKTLSHSPVPVLLPADSALLSSAVPTVQPHGYSASMHGQALSVLVVGTRLQVVLPSLAGRIKAGESYAISHSAGIVRLSFLAFRVAYQIEVDCDAPETDPRCLQDDYVRSLYRQLRRLGGAP